MTVIVKRIIIVITLELLVITRAIIRTIMTA